MASWMCFGFELDTGLALFLSVPLVCLRRSHANPPPTGAPRATQFGSGWRFCVRDISGSWTCVGQVAAEVKVWWPLVQIHQPSFLDVYFFSQWYPNGSINNLEVIWWCRTSFTSSTDRAPSPCVSGLLSYVDGALNVGGHCCLSLIRSALPKTIGLVFSASPRGRCVRGIKPSPRIACNFFVPAMIFMDTCLILSPSW